MYSFILREEPHKQEFNTAKALSEKNTSPLNFDPWSRHQDDFDFYAARDSANRLQSDYLDW